MDTEVGTSVSEVSTCLEGSSPWSLMNEDLPTICWESNVTKAECVRVCSELTLNRLLKLTILAISVENFSGSRKQD